MAEQNKNQVICRNGHPQPVSYSRFCIYCGTPLNSVPVQPNQNQSSDNQPPNQNHPNGQTPVQPARPTVPQQVQPLNQNNQPPIQPIRNFPPHNQPNQNFQPPNNQHYQQGQQNQAQYFPAAPSYQQPAAPIQPPQCYACGDGKTLDPKKVICKECNWLRPLAPGYRLDQAAFEWAADGKAMAALRSMKTLNAAAQAVSEKVGRRWIEVTFNGVLLGEKQLPHIYGQAVRAARILGMSHMPDIYLSGERAWDCLTFGSHKDSFVVIGSALAGNFQGADMLFLLAREMGHCRAGHALWKTVIRFFLGEQGPGRGMMAGGIFNAILNPAALIEGAIEVPLLAWARQAEITADRAGLLALGDESVARRVLLSWSLKSSMLYRQINIEAWLEQQAADDDGYSKLSELTTTSTPYIAPRLKLLSDFAKSRELQHWRKMISQAIQQGAPKPPPKSSALPSDVVRLKCATCQTPMRVPAQALAGKQELPVKCPNQKCGKITRLKKTVKPAEKAATAPKPRKNEENIDYGD